METEPLGAIERLQGRVWKKVLDRSRAAATTSAQHRVISTKLFAGRLLIHVFSERAARTPAFDPVDVDLEDVYFTTMAGLTRVGRRCRGPRRRHEGRLRRDSPLRAAVLLPAESPPTSISASSSPSPFCMINAIGGAWQSVNMAVGGSSGTVHVNSPYVLTVVAGVDQPVRRAGHRGAARQRRVSRLRDGHPSAVFHDAGLEARLLRRPVHRRACWSTPSSCSAFRSG